MALVTLLYRYCHLNVENQYMSDIISWGRQIYYKYLSILL